MEAAAAAAAAERGPAFNSRTRFNPRTRHNGGVWAFLGNTRGDSRTCLIAESPVIERPLGEFKFVAGVNASANVDAPSINSRNTV